jgi:hypothetical protein
MASPAPEFENAFAATIICKVPTIEMARKLPVGSIVGDHHGGVTFTDGVAAVLESRSHRGWKQLQLGNELWTLISLDR